MADNGMPPGFGPTDPTAPDRAETEHASCGFKICEFPPGPGETDSTPWIMIEIDEPGLKILHAGDAFLGLQFRAGVSFEEGRAFAHQLDRMIKVISCTKFIT